MISKTDFNWLRFKSSDVYYIKSKSRLNQIDLMSTPFVYRCDFYHGAWKDPDDKTKTIKSFGCKKAIFNDFGLLIPKYSNSNNSETYLSLKMPKLIENYDYFYLFELYFRNSDSHDLYFQNSKPFMIDSTEVNFMLSGSDFYMYRKNKMIHPTLDAKSFSGKKIEEFASLSKNAVIKDTGEKFNKILIVVQKKKSSEIGYSVVDFSLNGKITETNFSGLPYDNDVDIVPFYVMDHGNKNTIEFKQIETDYWISNFKLFKGIHEDFVS